MKRMVLIKTQVYLSLQKGGYQAKVFWVLDKPAVRERKSCDTEQTQPSNAVFNHLIISMTFVKVISLEWHDTRLICLVRFLIHSVKVMLKKQTRQDLSLLSAADLCIFGADW